MRCEEYLIGCLTEENMDKYHTFMQMADMYNAEKLREYCYWYFRRFMRSQTDLTEMEEEEDMPGSQSPEEESQDNQ